MKILAYVDQRYLQATVRALGAGIEILTSPPLFATDVWPGWLGGKDLLYLDLHGQPGSVYLYSGPQQQWAALSLTTVRGMDLTGCVVFATTCFLEQTPFLRTFLEVGAEGVIAGSGRNYAAGRNPVGAQTLAAYLVGEMRRGLSLGAGLTPARTALERTKRRLRVSWQMVRYPQATRDALGFRLWTKDET